MLYENKVVSFVPTQDAAVARAFYESILGLRFLSEDKFAVVFEMHEATLRVVSIDEFEPAKYTILGWEIVGIEDVAIELKEKGVVFERYEWLEQDYLGIWTAPNGDRVAWFKDPDGNVLSISEHLV